ncbi:MAG: hypothetical protein Q4P66_02190, partial [Actinomycetaceae bacterium]|nr:hypothetical protein [Actinomycetaceae bacterium]
MFNQQELKNQVQKRSWLPNILNACALALDLVAPLLVVVAISLQLRGELHQSWVWWIAGILTG